jgi:threonine dehydrogenase-like Zn-dependent dehydrogenase
MGGTLVLVGAVFPTVPVSLLPEQIVSPQLTVRGIHNDAPRHLVQAVEFLTAQHPRYPFASLVREWHSLSDIPAVLSQPHRLPAIRINLHPAR